MQKSYRFDFTGGVNVVGDKAVLKDTFVTVADNCDLRSGSPRPYKMPEYDHTPTAGTKQIFKYRGKWYYSSVERSYEAEYVGGRDRIYFTQYGGNARKIVDGVETSLGLNPPKTPPTVTQTIPLQTTPTVSYSDGGNFGPLRTRSYRIAVETKGGVLPPGGRVTIQTPADVDSDEEAYPAKKIDLQWTRVEGAIRYWIFAGDGGDEALLEKVSAGALSYTDSGTKGTNGDLATNYATRAPYLYFYTFERFVNGMRDESGPSPASPQVESTIGRTIKFDTLGDGFFGQDGAVAITSGITVTPSLTAYPALNIVSNVSQPNLNQVKFTTDLDHGFATGDKARFVYDDDSNWYEVEHEVIIDTTDTKVFYVRNAVAPTGATGTVSASKFVINLSPAPANPVQDDEVIYLGSLVGAVSYDSKVITSIVGKATRVSDTQFVVDEYLGLRTGASSITSTNLRYVPKNGYIRYRNLYRTGDTDSYLLVKQIPLETTEFVDNITAANLGEVPDSFYDQDGVTVVYSPPPIGATGLTRHYDMLFAIDGHAVVWSDNNRPDGWFSGFRQEFGSKPMALASFSSALIVLCEDALYRLEGNVSTQITPSKTMAEDGCIAPGSVQRTGAGLVYLSKRGLMLFDGQYARCITDMKVPGRFFTHPSVGAESIYSISEWGVSLIDSVGTWIAEEV